MWVVGTFLFCSFLSVSPPKRALTPEGGVTPCGGTGYVGGQERLRWGSVQGVG